MRVIVCGSRHWTDREAIRAALAQWGPDTTVVHGGAPGADTIAGEVAAELGMAVEVFPADWKAHGKAAGPIRNRRMLEAGAVALIAFPLADSRGTWDMVRRAGSKIPVFMPTPQPVPSEGA